MHRHTFSAVSGVPPSADPHETWNPTGVLPFTVINSASSLNPCNLSMISLTFICPFVPAFDPTGVVVLCRSPGVGGYHAVTSELLNVPS